MIDYNDMNGQKSLITMSTLPIGGDMSSEQNTSEQINMARQRNDENSDICHIRTQRNLQPATTTFKLDSPLIEVGSYPANYYHRVRIVPDCQCRSSVL